MSYLEQLLQDGPDVHKKGCDDIAGYEEGGIEQWRMPFRPSQNRRCCPVYGPPGAGQPDREDADQGAW